MPLKDIPPENFRPLFENSMDAVFLTIPDGRILAANSAACALFGMTEAELCAAGRDVLVDSDCPVFRGFLRERQRLGKARAEVTYRKKGGETFVGDTSSVIVQENRQAFVIVRDITSRKKLEAERDLLVNELETIIRFLPEGVVLCGPDGEILRLNPAAQAMLGYSLEAQQQSLKDRYPSGIYVDDKGERIPMEELPLARALKGETVKSETVGYIQPTGKFLWLSVSAAPVFSADGRVQGVVAIDADITRLRQLQQEKEGFLHTITHDLRNPLTVIQGHTELLAEELKKTDFGEFGRANIESVLFACGQISGMMKNLSELAGLESGNLPIECEEIDLLRFLREYLERARVIHDISRVIRDLPPSLPLVWADPRSLERCLGNLIGNALKYSDPGSPIRLSARHQGKEIVVSVKDQGPGIPPEDLPHIFERFYRARNISSRGLGLGLFISRSLVEANGGRIWVESRPGQGSTFHFSLRQATRSSMSFPS
jgi:PAS domain S-box-containing protein